MILLLNYDNLDKYDKVFISKVFTDTKVPDNVLSMGNVEYGGTGFFYDKANPLPCKIEHHMPDYDLYKEWALEKMNSGTKRSELTYYLDYSIGFTTRGCFRKCSFCVNRNSDKVNIHSNINEFLDPNRKYICLLDDNVLGTPKWRDIFSELNNTGKKFQYKQGLDERLLTDEKCDVLLKSNYIGDYIFAFDNIEDREIIEDKLKLWNKNIRMNNKRCGTKFYVFVGLIEIMYMMRTFGEKM